MESIFSAPFFLSILYLISFCIYVFLGVHTIHGHFSDRLNRFFMYICVSLAFWSIGFSMAVSAANLETCMLWRRISALGWCTIFGFLVCYFLELAQVSTAARRRWISLPLFLPMFPLLYAFTFSDSITSRVYHFVRADWGWVNITKNSSWDILFNFYYLFCITAAIFLILSWKKMHSLEPDHPKQASLILLSLFAAGAIGSASDIFYSSLMNIPSPQLGPLLCLFPILTVFFMMKRYGYMREKDAGSKDLILDVTSRSTMYAILTFIFAAGSLVCFLAAYLPASGMHIIHAYQSVVLFVLAILTKILQYAVLPNQTKDNYILCFACIAISVTMLGAENIAGISIWAVPLVFVIPFILFTRRRMIVVLGIIAVILQILLWIRQPSTQVTINAMSYISRILLILITSGLALYVNELYVQKLKAGEWQLKYQELFAALSSEFITVNLSNFDAKVIRLLEKCSEFFHIDRAYLFLFDEKETKIEHIVEWHADGIHPITADMKSIDLDVYPWLRQQICKNDQVAINDVSLLPKEAAAEKETFLRDGVKSLLGISVKIGRDHQGLLCFETLKVTQKWDEQHVRMLKIGAAILSEAITKNKVERAKNYLAYYDQLTGLPNRTLFNERAQQAIQIAERAGNTVAILFLDLDSFKSINDTLGHEAGDEMLILLSEEISGRLRDSDVICRFGGDEFIILINGVETKTDILTAANRIMEVFDRPLNIRNEEFFITGSMGISVYPFNGNDLETLVKTADIAMYQAKMNGKNQISLCSPNMKEDIKRATDMSNRLYRAIERNELFLLYQPQINMLSNEIVGAEVLIRWNSGEFGLVSPTEFIPLAEKNGLINQISEWILETACRQYKSWLEKGLPEIRLSVNLSPIQLRYPQAVSRISRILQITRMPTQNLEIEITESILTDDSKKLASVIYQLKSLGVTLAIDDFGIGHSSLNRLKMLPIDRLKMDREFVHSLETNVRDQALAKAIIEFSRNIGTEIIAEGVETQTQRDFLCENRCSEAQGFFFYRPMPAEKLEALLAGASGRNYTDELSREVLYTSLIESDS